MRREVTVEEYAAGVRSGNRAVLGRALDLVESNRSNHRHLAQELLRSLQPVERISHRVGISGVPGVGKSAFIESLGLELDLVLNRDDPTTKRTRTRSRTRPRG